MMAELTVVVTFHREGLFAYAALRSYMRSRQHASAAGSQVKFVLVLDNADEKTSAIVRGHPDLEGDELILVTSAGDPALARNLGIEQARSTFVCILDGDDLISRDYFQRHLAFAAAAPVRSVLHAEVVASFGRENGISLQLDQRSMPFSPDVLLHANPWISAVFARREVFSQTMMRPSSIRGLRSSWRTSTRRAKANRRRINNAPIDRTDHSVARRRAWRRCSH